MMDVTLPTRTLDTMSDAIALSSPNGRMSARARRAATDRLSAALFGPNATRERFTGRDETPENERKAESLRRSAKTLRDLAAKGMQTRKYLRKAEEMEAQAHALSPSTAL